MTSGKLPSLYVVPAALDKPDQTPGMYERLPGRWCLPGECEPSADNARAGALRAAQWLLRNQISSAENLSGDTGRYISLRGLMDNTLYMTQNWLAAHCVLGVLAAWRATGDDAYLTSARLGGEYLLGLQIHDARLGDDVGIYREHHARFPLAGSRSGCSVVWAMVGLFQATGDQEYLDSALLYARWYFKKAFPPGAVFPRHDYLIDQKRWASSWSGCYHGGVAAIFHQLYKVSGQEEILRRGVIEIMDSFVKHVLRPDGSRQQAIDTATGRPVAANEKSFHVYNDDFAGLGLLAAYKETGDKKYLEASERQARWLAGKTEDSGRLGGVSSAPATALVHFLAHRKLTGTSEFDETMRRFVQYLLGRQITTLARADLHGGLTGQSHHDSYDETGQYIDARTTSYAICGLLGFADPATQIFLDVM